MSYGYPQQDYEETLSERAYIKAKCIAEIFHNPETLYTVSRMRVIETTESLDEKEIMIVGIYPHIIPGEIYIFWGRLSTHQKFGLQYQIDRFQQCLPEEREGMIDYLSSDLFPGIGKVSATAIVDAIGDNAIRKLLQDPALLNQIKGITQEKKDTLIQKLKENQGLEEIMIALGDYGIGLQLAVEIYQLFGEEAMDILKQDPYRLIEEVEGIGFKRADSIGRAMGIAATDPKRVQAACIYYVREQCEQQGHVYYPLELVLTGVKQWLRNILSEDDILREIEALCLAEKLYLEEDRLYVPSLFFAEKGFVKKVKQLLNRPAEEINEQDFYSTLGLLEEQYRISYNEQQKEAIYQAMKSPMLIVTGGPGTGKTTVIRGICETFAELHGLSLEPKYYAKKDEPYPLLLVAPTGRAAKRMSESTGIPAVTIHRLLGWRGGKEFEYDDETQLQGRLIIIDESSMMDQWLAHQLFRAIPDHFQVILVGDEDQLPSVGPGQVLKDLLACQAIPIVRLTEIYRQAEGSSIITLAHQIKNNEAIEDLAQAKADRRFFSCRAEQVVDVVVQVCSSALKKGYTLMDIQVLAPIYKGEAGIDKLNEALQAALNPPSRQKREVKHGERIFRVGDKILQLVNDAEQHIYNGDIGEIKAVRLAKAQEAEEDEVIILFEQKEVVYKKGDLNQITLAYCCSVHKAQGSEFPIVVIPIVRQYARMLNKNLVYTAITRGQDYLILGGEEQAFLEAIAQKSQGDKRFTFLKESLSPIQ